MKSSLEKMYNAWTKSLEIEKWFLKKCEYHNANDQLLSSDLAVEKGSVYHWSWYLFDQTESGKILEANGKDLFQFTFAGDCIVDVKLKEENEHVIVELTQKNIPLDEDSRKNIRLGCDSGWSFFLVNLKSYYENEIDLRNKNEELKGMLNN